jgi:hypothetical protein
MLRFVASMFTFRSRNHRGWFLMSVTFFSFFLFGRFSDLQGNELKAFIGTNVVVLLVYVITTILAFFETDRGTKVSGDFSPDCIWFNGVVSIAYSALVISYFT